ncbi:MAG TPA: SRPBCC family protein [Gaiellaceae bacterium]
MISAERVIPAEPERVFEFLSDLRNHWRLETAFVRLQDVDGSGGTIRLRGPFGLSREVRTRVLEAEPARRVAGRADLSGGTVGLVAWELLPAEGGTNVRLSASVPEASLLDRLILALGGRRWLGRLFSRALANLEAAL